MKKTILYWVPRVLGIGFVAFISLFALDVFDEGYGFWQTILALLIHLVPTFLTLAALLVAWRWELAGGIIYMLLGFAYVIMMSGQHWLAYAIITGPLLLTGLLFIINHSVRNRRVVSV